MHTAVYVVVGSGDETCAFKFAYIITIRHVTAKFAHMNGHWKVYDSLFKIGQFFN